MDHKVDYAQEPGDLEYYLASLPTTPAMGEQIVANLAAVVT